MNATCPACSARYRIDDAKVRGRAARMRCKTCMTEWIVAAQPEPATQMRAEPARAAVVRKGKEREKRDLFAAQPEEPPPSSARPSFRPAPSYGARNENSVLFTVDALKAAARASAPPPAPAAETPAWTAASVTPSLAPAAPAVLDHEGIIDLKALSSSLPPRTTPSVFPSAPPSSGFACAVDAAKSGGDPAFVAHVKGLVSAANPRIAAFALAGLSALIVMGVGLSMAFGGEPAHQLAQADIAQARVSAVAARVAVTVEETARAKAAVASMPAAEPKASTTSKPAGKSTHHAGYVWRSSGGSSPARAATASPKPKKSADTCGCHGDFQCIIRCSAKGK